MPLPKKPSKPSFLRRSRFRGETCSEFTGGRRSCDTNPRFSLDAGRMSVDDVGFSWDEPCASWDGYLFGAGVGIGIGRPPPLLSRLPPILSALEDSPVGIVERSDGQIPVEGDSQPGARRRFQHPGGLSTDARLLHGHVKPEGKNDLSHVAARAMASSASTSGEWLKGALQDLRGRMGSALELDADLISGLVSFCELAPPPDAADYLANIIGVEAAQDLIQEYLQRRGYIDPSKGTESLQSSNLQPYVKPSADAATTQTKKQTRTQKDAASSSSQSSQSQSETTEPHVSSKRGPKKKGVKVISLAEAAKGSIVFKQGKPCSCQAREHNLVSNCLSCGKIVCEQEGEGPCSFCGALVLREGSTYAGLSDVGVPLSEAEAEAEAYAYAKRLVDYDRDSAARTMVYDDQVTIMKWKEIVGFLQRKSQI